MEYNLRFSPNCVLLRCLIIINRNFHQDNSTYHIILLIFWSKIWYFSWQPLFLFATFIQRYLLLNHNLVLYLLWPRGQKLKFSDFLPVSLLFLNSKSQIQMPTEVKQVYICVPMIKPFSNSQSIKCYYKAKCPPNELSYVCKKHVLSRENNSLLVTSVRSPH